jgi:hypothetical protein
MLFITKRKEKKKGKKKRKEKAYKKKIFKYLFQQASIFIRFLKFCY